jgi:5-methylthioadenosine/S-adenosylhomocysteine deaminase
MATVQSAKVAHLDAGQIQPGKLADIAIIDIHASHLQPFHSQDIFNMLVFCAQSSDVRHTIIHGELVMKDRQITRVDENAILQEAAALDSEHMAGRQVFLNSAAS